MEPTEGKVVYTYIATLTDAGQTYDMTTGNMTGHFISVLGAKLWLGTARSNLTTGDRVRITITKEPDDGTK